MYAHRSRRRRGRLRRSGSLTPRQVAAALAAGLALAWYAHSRAETGARPAAARTATTAVVAAGAGGAFGCAQLERLWEEAGGSPSAAFLAAEVARAESGGDPDAVDVDGNGTVDRGLWQINSIWGPESTYSALGSARAAVAISRDGADWSPWVTYQRGLEDGQC